MCELKPFPAEDLGGTFHDVVLASDAEAALAAAETKQRNTEEVLRCYRNVKLVEIEKLTRELNEVRRALWMENSLNQTRVVNYTAQEYEWLAEQVDLVDLVEIAKPKEQNDAH